MLVASRYECAHHVLNLPPYPRLTLEDGAVGVDEEELNAVAVDNRTVIADPQFEERPKLGMANYRAEHSGGIGERQAAGSVAQQPIGRIVARIV